MARLVMRCCLGALAAGGLAGSLALAQSSPDAAGRATPEHPAIQACNDAFQPGQWGAHAACLQKALGQQGRELSHAWAFARQRALRSMDPPSALRLLNASAGRWRQYKKAECERRYAAVAGRNHPDITDLECDIRVNAARIAHLRSDD